MKFQFKSIMNLFNWRKPHLYFSNWFISHERKWSMGFDDVHFLVWS